MFKSNNMETIKIRPLPDSELTKSSRELIALHKKVLRHYLMDRENFTYREYTQFDYLYDNMINEDNIAQVFHLPAQVFVQKLISYYRNIINK